jgi:hypothetical protein
MQEDLFAKGTKLADEVMLTLSASKVKPKIGLSNLEIDFFSDDTISVISFECIEYPAFEVRIEKKRNESDLDLIFDLSVNTVDPVMFNEQKNALRIIFDTLLKRFPTMGVILDYDYSLNLNPEGKINDIPNARNWDLFNSIFQ